MAEGKTPTWIRSSAGGLLALVVVQLILGFYLNLGYTPSPDGAIRSMEKVRESAASGWLQGAHYWGSAWLIAHSFIQLLILLLSGDYRRVSKGVWLSAVALFGTAFLMQLTGNLLPFDRHDVQTAVVEGSLASRVPAVGELAASTMLQGQSFGVQTLEAWHRFHVLLIVPMVLAAAVAAFGVRPAERAKGWRRFGWTLPLAAVALLAATVPSPTGTPATPDDYVAFDARPGWYVWPMHGALNAFESLSNGLGWIGTALLPGLFAALLVLAPWLGAKRDPWVRGAAGLFVLAFGVFGVLFGGKPAPAWGPQNPTVASFDESSELIDEALAKRGFELAVKTCSGCHGANLTGGPTAPNLTIQYRRHSDADYFIRFIRKPQSVRAGSTMPAFGHLSEEELAALAEWLRKDKSGS